MPRPIRHLTRMGATGTQRSRRTVRLPTRSTNLPRMDRRQPCRARTVPKLLPGPPPAVNITPRANHRMARNTRSKTATCTRTPGAAGSRPRGNRTIPARAATLILVPRLLRGGDRKRRAADRPPLAEAPTVGNPGQRVLEVRIAAVVAEAGAVVGKRHAA